MVVGFSVVAGTLVVGGRAVDCFSVVVGCAAVDGAVVFG